jgi:K+-transporting ATPase KdpF subunit
LANSHVSFGHCNNGTDVCVPESLRENIKNEVTSMMIYVTAGVAAFLFVYLVVALVRPEWF